LFPFGKMFKIITKRIKVFKFLKEYMPFYKNYKKEIFFAIIGMLLVSISTAATAFSQTSS